MSIELENKWAMAVKENADLRQQLAEAKQENEHLLDGNTKLLSDNIDLSNELAAQAAELATLRESLGKAQEEQSWIRRKLKIAEDCPSHKVYGEMHVLESHAHGYTTYIESFKCDDMQGEIARLTVANATLRERLAAMEVIAEQLIHDDQESGDDMDYWSSCAMQASAQFKILLKGDSQ